MAVLWTPKPAMPYLWLAMGMLWKSVVIVSPRHSKQDDRRRLQRPTCMAAVLLETPRMACESGTQLPRQQQLGHAYRGASQHQQQQPSLS